MIDRLIDSVRDYSPPASLATEVATETKFGTKVASLECEDDARTSNTRIAQRNRAIPHSTLKNRVSLTLGADQ